MSEDPIRLLARYAADATPESLPEGTLDSAARLFVDSIGCMFAGTSAEGIPALIAATKQFGGSGPSRLVGLPGRFAAQDAAFLNAVFCHARDYDDTHDAAVNHGCVTVVPALLALAEASVKTESPPTGREILAAMAVGLDVANRIGLAVISKLHTGWLPTTLWGPFGAAAACGSLLGLDEDAMSNAFGFAFAQAHGNRQALVEGTLAKRVQPGFAAAAGLKATILAAEGISAPEAVGEGEFGIRKLIVAGRVDADAFRDAIVGELGCRNETNHVSIKPYPCCRCTHAVIDGALRLGGWAQASSRGRGAADRERAVRDGSGRGRTVPDRSGQRKSNRNSSSYVDPAVVDRVIVRLPPHSMGQIGRPFEIRDNPTVDAQFSAAYTAALAWLGGRPGLADLAQTEVCSRTDVHALAAKITCREFEPENSGIAPIEIDVHTTEGRRHSVRVEAPKGSPQNPMTSSEVEAKFTDCLSFSASPIPPELRARIFESMSRIADTEDFITLINRITGA